MNCPEFLDSFRTNEGSCQVTRDTKHYRSERKISCHSGQIVLCLILTSRYPGIKKKKQKKKNIKKKKKKKKGRKTEKYARRRRLKTMTSDKNQLICKMVSPPAFIDQNIPFLFSLDRPQFVYYYVNKNGQKDFPLLLEEE